ncbi:MAG: hypothetical protein WA874_16495 [Chryseosolibacter sp.]
MSKNIDGIYNYCDRWCERCTFTSHCAVYEDETDLAPEEKDMQNKAFWERLGQNFSKAQDILQKAAAHFGADVDADPHQEEEKQKRQEQIKKESREHPLSKLTLQYSDQSRIWLKTQPGMLDRLETLKTELTIGIETEADARRKTEIIKDSLAVIQWYQVFIHVKLMRAIMGKLSNDGWAEENGFQTDFDGSAKIALIAIERSMHAWSALFEILPGREDDFLRILALLEKIKNIVTEEFPKAEGFVRPGFDDYPALAIR